MRQRRGTGRAAVPAGGLAPRREGRGRQRHRGRLVAGGTGKALLSKGQISQASVFSFEIIIGDLPPAPSDVRLRGRRLLTPVEVPQALWIVVRDSTMHSQGIFFW